MNRLLCIIPTISLLHAIPESKEITSKGNPPKGMVWIKGTTYTRGTKENPNIPFNDEERPVHKVTVSGFYLDEHEVTNAQFGDFVDATGYKTQACYRQGLDDNFTQTLRNRLIFKNLL